MAMIGKMLGIDENQLASPAHVGGEDQIPRKGGIAFDVNFDEQAAIE